MLHSLIIWIVIGLIAGWLASLFLGGKGFVRYIVVGILGSVVGGFLLSVMGINLSLGNALISDIVTAFIGALIVIAIARFIAR